MSTKKEEIICKVSSLIHSRGYVNTKLSDILKEVNIGKGQFYHYFSSKQDLSEAVIDYLISQMSQSLFENILNKELPPKEKLNRMIEEIYNMQKEDNGAYGCPIGNLAIELSADEGMFRSKIANFFEQWEEGVKKTLDAMQQVGELDPNLDTLKKARSIVAMMEGAILRSKSSQDLGILRDIIDVIRKEYQLE